MNTRLQNYNSQGDRFKKLEQHEIQMSRVLSCWACRLARRSRKRRSRGVSCDHTQTGEEEGTDREREGCVLFALRSSQTPAEREEYNNRKEKE